LSKIDQLGEIHTLIRLKMKIKSVLGFFKLCVLTLVVFHHQSYGVDNISPIAKEVKEVINGISDCHVHSLYDELDLDGPNLNPSVTIWKTNASHDARLRKYAKCQFRKHDITHVKRIHCVYAIIFLASQRQVYARKRKPSGGAGPPVWVNFNRVISYAFHTLQNCFWEDTSRSVEFKGSIRKLSSFSYVLFFTRLRPHQWLQILEIDPTLLSFSSRTALRYFSNPKAKSKAYFQCLFCPNEIPLLIPMKKAEQGNINSFNSFTRKLQHKVLKVESEIDSISYEWYTNELKVNLLSKSRAFDSPKLFRGLLNDILSSKRGHQLFILNILAEKYNNTVMLCPFDTKSNPMCSRYQLNDSLRHSRIVLPNNDELVIPREFVGSALIVIGMEGQKFLTCYYRRTVSFRFYMEPFQRDLWITLAFTSFMMAFLLHFYILKFHKSKMLKFSPYLFILSTITDDNCAMPGGLAREPVIRIALGPWFLMTVVLVNAYVGLVITGLTSPLPKESVDSFSNLTKMQFNPEQIARGLLWTQKLHNYELNLNLKNVLEEENFFAASGTRKFDSEIDFKIYSSLDRGAVELAVSNWMSDPAMILYPLEVRHRVYRYLEAFGKFLLLMYGLFLRSEGALVHQVMDRNLSIELRRGLLKNAAISTMEDTILLNLIVPEHISVPASYFSGKWNYSFESAVEEEITKCGRSAYADIRSVVDLEHKYLTRHYPWINFVLSKEEISKQIDSWAFPNMLDNDPILDGMNAFFYRNLPKT
jgi:hypothetical protein